MNEFSCRSCQTHRYLWVLGKTEVEPRNRVIRAHQGGATFDRSTEGFTEVMYFCRRCGRRDSMRITDPGDFPDRAEVLEDSEVEAELGYVLGPGESPRS